MKLFCDAYCEHGGVCDLDAGHEGQHSASGYCHWDDANSVDKETADNLYRLKGGPIADAVIKLSDAITEGYFDDRDAES